MASKKELNEGKYDKYKEVNRDKYDKYRRSK